MTGNLVEPKLQNETFNDNDFGAYVGCYPLIQDDWDGEIGASFNSSDKSQLTYSYVYEMLLNDMIGNYNATDIEVKDFANFAGCYMYRNGWDWSTVAFEACYGNVNMGYANECKEGKDVKLTYQRINDYSGVLEFLKDLVFNNSDLVNYLYNFPVYLKKKRISN